MPKSARAKLPAKIVEPESSSILFEQITPNVHKATFQDVRAGWEGWHVERWGEPKPIGAVWLRFYLDPLGDLQFDVVSAVV